MDTYIALYLLSCVPFLLAGTRLDYDEFRRKNKQVKSKMIFDSAVILIALLWPLAIIGMIIHRWWRWLH